MAPFNLLSIQPKSTISLKRLFCFRTGKGEVSETSPEALIIGPHRPLSTVASAALSGASISLFCEMTYNPRFRRCLRRVRGLPLLRGSNSSHKSSRDVILTTHVPSYCTRCAFFDTMSCAITICLLRSPGAGTCFEEDFLV